MKIGLRKATDFGRKAPHARRDWLFKTHDRPQINIASTVAHFTSQKLSSPEEDYQKSSRIMLIGQPDELNHVGPTWTAMFSYAFLGESRHPNVRNNSSQG